MSNNNSSASKKLNYDKNLGPYYYSEEDVLGKGAYGSVYRAYDTRTSGSALTAGNADLPQSLRGTRVVALKAMSNPNVEDGFGAATLREILILKELQEKLRSDRRRSCVLNAGGLADYKPEGSDGADGAAHAHTLITPKGKTKLISASPSPEDEEAGAPADSEDDDYDSLAEYNSEAVEAGRRYVVHLHDVIIKPQGSMVFAAIDLCEGGDLWGYLRKLPDRCLRDPVVFRRWMREVTQALAFLHSRHITHRDMKPQNIMLKQLEPEEIAANGEQKGDKNTNVLVVNSTYDSTAGDVPDARNFCMKVADFGLSRVEGVPIKKYVHEAVTLWYRSPDVLLGSTNYTYSADAWSLGCIIAEVASGSALFRGRDDNEQFKRIFARIGGLNPPCFPSMKAYPHSEAYEEILARTCAYYAEEQKRGILEAEEKQELAALRSAGETLPSPYIEHLARIKAHLRAYFTSHEGMGVLGDKGLDLVARLFIVEPKQRLTVLQAVDHPFFVDGAAGPDKVAAGGARRFSPKQYLDDYGDLLGTEDAGANGKPKKPGGGGHGGADKDGVLLPELPQSSEAARRAAASPKAVPGAVKL